MSNLRTNVNNKKAPTKLRMLMIQLLRTLFEDLTYSRRLYQGFSWFCFRRETWKKKYNRTYTFLFIQSVNEYNLKLIALKKIVHPERVGGGTQHNFIRESSNPRSNPFRNLIFQHTQTLERCITFYHYLVIGFEVREGNP